MKNFHLLRQQQIGIFLMTIFLMFSLTQTTFVSAGNSDQVFETAQEKAVTAFTQLRKIILILGAIGILVLAVMAFFGRFSMMWLVSLIGGLVMVLLVGYLIDFLSGEDISGELKTK